jgi:hypothetical protein
VIAALAAPQIATVLAAVATPSVISCLPRPGKC